MKSAFPLKSHFVIWAALMLLLVATWAVAQIHLGPFNTIVALSIALAKMLLVILYFMHVRFGSRLTWVFVVAGFFWLGILVTLGMSDYLSRGW